MHRRLDSAAIRLVPADWRDAVERDLRDERPADAGSLWFAPRAAAIGVRLRLARLTGDAAARRRPPLTVSPRRSPMQDFGRDITFAVRGVFRRPGYALAVIATLAIGIGANTAIFSVFNWILFRPLPGVSRPGELVTIRYQGAKREGSFFVSYRDYADVRDAVTGSVTGLAAVAPRAMELSTGDDTQRVNAQVVTVNYLSLFGVRPHIGRDFTAAEEQPGGPPSVVISRRLWRQAFGSSEGVLGSTVKLNGRSFTVVGVAPAGFQGTSMITPADVWLTLSGYATLMPQGATELTTSRRETMYSTAYGRLRPGVSIAQAQAEASATISNMPEFANRSGKANVRSGLEAVFYAGIGYEESTRNRLTTTFRLLMGAVGLLLLLACANAANLLLARSTARRREIAVCQAIGASRFRIIRQQLAEGLVLSFAAGVAGLAVAASLIWLFDGMRIVAYLPAVKGVSFDWRVAVFTLTASVATGLIFAAAPAVVSSRVNLQSSLKQGQGGASGGRRLLRGSLVTLQIAVSVLLLVAAGLFIRTLQNIRGLDLGIQPDGIVSFGIQPERFGLTTERSAVHVRELLERVRNAPGIAHAAFTWTTSFSPNRGNMMFSRADKPEIEGVATQTTVSPGFFETMGIPLIAGRDFTEAETRQKDDASGVVILSRRLANTVFPDGSALGGRLVLRTPEGKVLEVIGIAGDVRGRAVTREPEAWAYVPAVDPPWGTIQVRSTLPASQVIATIRDVAGSIDPAVAPHDIEAFGAAVDRALSEQRLFARVSGIFAALAALLAGIGIYGMMAGAVAERRKEFGIRLALGARSASVLALVLRPAVVLAVTGLLLGLGGAIALRRFVEARLYGVTSLDPVTIAGTACAILLLSVIASLVPALRAARVDPVRSLRVE